MGKYLAGGFMQSFGDLVRMARENAGLTQDDAAAAIRQKYGVRLSSAYLSMIERGERTNLTTKLENALKDFFNIQLTKAVDILEILEDKDTKITAGDQSITKEQRLSILRALINPIKESTKNFKVPLIGTIRAGIPIMARENWGDMLEIPADLEADFALEVKGDSMIGVGIHEGDYAICREAQTASVGNIVVALEDIDVEYAEATLKYYMRDNGQDVLRPANPLYDDIIIGPRHRIAGIMISLLRKRPTPIEYYRDYISTKNYALKDWDEIIEKAINYGIKPDKVKSFLEMTWEIINK